MTKIPNPHFGAIPNIPKPKVSGGIGSVSIGPNAVAEAPATDTPDRRVITVTATDTTTSPIQAAFAKAVATKHKRVKEASVTIPVKKPVVSKKKKK